MQSVYSQLFAFTVTIGIGFLAGILFDVYRVFRGIWRPGKLGTFLGDIIFWFIMTVTVFILLMIGNWGEMRSYVFLGIAIGAYLYVHFLSKKCQGIFRTFFIYILKILKTLWQIATWPFRILYKIVLVPIGFILSGLGSIYNLLGKAIGVLGQKFARVFARFRNRQPKDK